MKTVIGGKQVHSLHYNNSVETYNEHYFSVRQYYTKGNGECLRQNPTTYTSSTENHTILQKRWVFKAKTNNLQNFNIEIFYAAKTSECLRLKPTTYTSSTENNTILQKWWVFKAMSIMIMMCTPFAKLTEPTYQLPISFFILKL